MSEKSSHFIPQNVFDTTDYIQDIYMVGEDGIKIHFPVGNIQPCEPNPITDFEEVNTIPDYTEYKEGEPFQENIEVTAFDVAKYILDKLGETTTMKLQKLVYYCQAWSLVWDEKELFKEKIEAWANGPVVKSLYMYFKGMFNVSSDDMYSGNTDIFTQEQMDTMDAVIEYYGEMSAYYLIQLTHNEDPWKNTRKGLQPLERSNFEIPKELIASYYSSL